MIRLNLKALPHVNGLIAAHAQAPDALERDWTLAQLATWQQWNRKARGVAHLAMRGAPARAIQELAGHQDLGTTQRYMHLIPAALDAAIRLLDGAAEHRGGIGGAGNEGLNPATRPAGAIEGSGRAEHNGMASLRMLGIGSLHVRVCL